jgi:hypothetical protein
MGLVGRGWLGIAGINDNLGILPGSIDTVVWHRLVVAKIEDILRKERYRNRAAGRIKGGEKRTGADAVPEFLHRGKFLSRGGKSRWG